MKHFLRSAIVMIVVCGIVLAVWKLFGGDVGGFFASVWSFVYMLIDGISNVFIQIFGIFGFGNG